MTVTKPLSFTDTDLIANFTWWDTVKVKPVVQSSPYFTALAELEVFCVGPLLYRFVLFLWPLWVLILPEKTGWGLPGNGAIDWGLPQERATHRSNHRGRTVSERCSTKKQQTNASWDACSEQAAFCPHWYISCGGRFVGEVLWHQRRSHVTFTDAVVADQSHSKSL